MFMNPNLFFLASSSHLTVWNYEDHSQYELNPKFYLRLFKILRDPSQFDESRETDRQLLHANILTRKKIYPNPWGWDVLSKIYHMGTKDIPYLSPPKNVDEWAQQYLEHCNEAMAKKIPIQIFEGEGIAIELPPPTVQLEESSLIKNLVTRKTDRQFLTYPISLAMASTILHYSLGYPEERQNDENLVFEGYRRRRCSPSGGGLNCVEGYVYCSRVTGLAPGVYRYNPEHHSLTLQAKITNNILGDLLCGQHFVNELPFGVFLTARFDKLWWKYEHSRAYRMAFVEVGHVSQCIQLIATALGLNTWLTGAINESPVETLLLDKAEHEHVLFFTGAGYSNGEAIPQTLKSVLSENSQ